MPRTPPPDSEWPRRGHVPPRASRACLVGSALLTLLSCGQEPVPAGQLNRGLSGEPSSLDPAAAADSFSVQAVTDLYEGLTAESAAGVVPGVAESWRIDDGGKRYTFHLRAGVRWSNGQPLRAADFVRSWRRLLDPKQASPTADDLRLLAGADAIIAGRAPPDTLAVSAPADDVLIVQLERPAPYLPQVLAHSSAMPVYSDAAARVHEAAAWISNGPYVLSRWRPGGSLALVRNAAYWDAAHVHVPAVEYHFTSDDLSQYARYRAGQIDLTDSVPAPDLPAIRAERPGELKIAPFLATAYYGLNLSHPTLGGNAGLRTALAMAIDRRRLVSTLGFGQQPAFGFVPPGTWNYAPQSWTWASLDDAARVAAARRLYAAAGYSPRAPLHLRVLFNTNPVIKRTAVVIASMWHETLGIDAELIDEEYRVFLQSRHDPSRWDVVRLGWNADYNDAGNFLEVLRTGSANNDPGYANPAYDALLDRAATAEDLAERRGLLEHAEQVMLADVPIVPLYFLVSKQLVKPYVLGVEPTALNVLPTKSLTLLPH